MVEYISSEQVVERLKHVSELYHRLILLVVSNSCSKQKVIHEINKKVDADCININLEISKRMLDMTARQRSLNTLRLLEEIIAESNTDTVILDNIEILFDVLLKQDPLKLLQSISRNKTVIAAWNGAVDNDHLVYAIPSHQEYRKYSMADLVVIDAKKYNL